jgi:alanyl-tRNA synthetase
MLTFGLPDFADFRTSDLSDFPTKTYLCTSNYTYMTAQEIRQAFLDFFASKQHTIVPSAPIVVKNDPTLMFTNAGMNQFKAVFLGEEPVKFPRVADTQRCLRVSGKHNDLEEVGIDNYHHTMFEMLGNWSFGDYFKKEAIAWSWELLTEVYKLDKDRLYVTYFEGDEKDGLATDTETLELWRALVAEDHILPGNKKDNFWEMGETGPCGPCCEIHYDGRTDAERAKIPGARFVNGDDDSVMEIWNNVFMQFNRLKDGSLQPLPAKHVDTGMGFERLVRILQGKTSNYDTDVFMPLIQFIAEKSGIAYGKDEKTDIAMRVMADHVRAISFAIADGQLPSNNKAGYVIRRILRRAVRYSYQYLNFKEPFLNELVPLLAQQFEGVFTELVEQKDFVQKVVLEEEVSFLRTLERGIILFELRKTAIGYIMDRIELAKGNAAFGEGEFIEGALAAFDEFLLNGKRLYNDVELTKLEASLNTTRTVDDAYKIVNRYIKTISGDFVFELSDTYGFPIDLTELMARELGWTVDIPGYEAALQQQKLRSRTATAVDTGDWIVFRGGDTRFVGYDETMVQGVEILKYRKVTAQGKEQYQVVLNDTPFYAEGGGQVGDTGFLTSEWYDEQTGPLNLQVMDTKRENGLIIHIVEPQPTYTPDGKEQPGKLPNPMPRRYMAYVNPTRMYTNANHSATHLLNAALRQVLGEHISQKGSLVTPEYLRFDFSHFSKISEGDLEGIERTVNAKIRECIPLKEERNVYYRDAIASGATAAFGEKYGDFVRVITFGDDFSKELCGGTHVKNTGEIGIFKIISESAVAAGVRRIEAVSSVFAENYISEQFSVLKDVKDVLKNPANVKKSLETLLEDNARMKKELEKGILLKASGLKQGLADKAQDINGINFIAEKVELPNADAIKNLAYSIKDIVPNLFLVLVADIEGKPSITVMVAENLVKEKGLNAGSIIRELAKEIQGGGGGQPFYATAGGKDVSGLPKVLEKARTFIPA